jgi:hypothetical protein
MLVSIFKRCPPSPLRSNSTEIALDATGVWPDFAKVGSLCPTTMSTRLGLPIVLTVLSLNPRGCPHSIRKQTIGIDRSRLIVPARHRCRWLDAHQSGSNQAARRLFEATAVLDLRTVFFSAASAVVTRAMLAKDAAKISR